MIVIAFLKRRQGTRREPAWPGSRRFHWSRSKRLLYLVPVVLCGCKSMMQPVDPPPAPQSANGASLSGAGQNSSLAQAARSTKKAQEKADRAQDRTSFPSKLTREQEYNAHLELGRFQESQENFDLALGEYLKALEACETHSALLEGGKNIAKQAMAHRRMGTALDRLGRFEQAENEYRTALKLSPNDPKVWNDAGYSYYLQGRWADAERSLKTAEKLDPHNTRIMTNLGLTLAASGQTEPALAEFTRAGGNAAGHTNLAYILAAMGNTAEAEKHYKLALAIQPDLGPAKTALAALDAKVAYESRLVAARSAAQAPPLLINQPGVLPTAAPRMPPPAGSTLAVGSTGTTSPQPPPVLINHPGVLPVTAPRMPPPAATTLAARPSGTMSPWPSSLLINEPGALPVAAPRTPTTSGTALATRPPGTTSLRSAGRPNPASPPKPATNPIQAPPATRVATTVPTDAAVRRSAAPAPRRLGPARTPLPSGPKMATTVPKDATVNQTAASATRLIPPARAPLPVPPLVPLPGPVPAFVPPLSN